jgi:hypothetical protein
MKRRLMDAALALIQRGFFVFPLRPGDKRPLPHFKHWEQRATRDPDLVYLWWLKAPYNIGVATGPSQLLVVDCDTARGLMPPPQWSPARGGLDVLRQLAAEARVSFPHTMAVRTPSGGIHFYFQAPGDHHLGNSAGRLGWHIDTRGIGGYVVGPGSVCSGRLYVVADRAPIAPLPTWITERLVPRLALPPVMPRERVTSQYLRAILDGEVARVRSARPGTRNDALNTAAFIMGQLVGSAQITEEDAWLFLRSASQPHVGVAGFTENELERTIKAGLPLVSDDRDRFGHETKTHRDRRRSAERH